MFSSKISSRLLALELMRVLVVFVCLFARTSLKLIFEDRAFLIQLVQRKTVFSGYSCGSYKY